MPAASVSPSQCGRTIGRGAARLRRPCSRLPARGSGLKFGARAQVIGNVVDSGNAADKYRRLRTGSGRFHEAAWSRPGGRQVCPACRARIRSIHRRADQSLGKVERRADQNVGKRALHELHWVQVQLLQRAIEHLGRTALCSELLWV